MLKIKVVYSSLWQAYRKAIRNVTCHMESRYSTYMCLPQKAE